MSTPLSELVDAYAQADADVKAAEDRRKDLRDQLLLAHAEVAADNSLEHGDSLLAGRVHVVRVSRTEGSWRCDTKRLRAEQPVIFAAYAAQGAPITRLTVTPR